MLSEVLPEAGLCSLFPEVLIGEHRGTPLGKPGQEYDARQKPPSCEFCCIEVLEKYWRSIED